MKPALVLVDVQNDFLARPGLYPGSEHLTVAIGTLLDAFRRASLPVIHVRTTIAADGSDSMPHWQRQGIRHCVRGTTGALPPPALSAIEGEALVEKRFFSGFETGQLRAALDAAAADTVVLAGLYTHGCIRATATDAYQYGYAVVLAADAIASTDSAHALASREWLQGRVGEFRGTAAIVAAVAGAADETGASRPDRPAIHVDGMWIAAPHSETADHMDPCDASRRLARIAIADAALVDHAVHATKAAGRDWASSSGAERVRLLEAWAGIVERRQESWAELIAVQVGKPIGDAHEEMQRTLAHLRASAALVATIEEGHGTPGLVTRHLPRCLVAVVTPWNNPIAIPVAKIASALAFGNAVVWKPALPAPAVAEAVVDSLGAAGFPPALVATVFGDASTAQALMSHPGIDAVSLTGSQRAGLDAALLCSRRGIALQAELGGNNAAIVMAGADLASAARALAGAAFGFAGQRCTATRRIIVDHGVREAFLEMLLRETATLPLGLPLDPATRVGPMISRARRDEVAAAVRRAVGGDGGRLLCGGTLPEGPGNWYPPTLVDGLRPDSSLVQEESFGPVAVIQDAADWKEALRLCNAVPQGLVASYFGADRDQQREFLLHAEAGILRLNPKGFPVAADAPFGGWKSSGMGPPEHGRWDREFFARAQAVYGMP